MIQKLVLRLNRRKGRGWYAEPLEWKVTGVISPLAHRWWGPPFGLVCSTGGIIVVRRSYAGFWAAGFMQSEISADDPYAVADYARGPSTAYSRNELRAITVRWRLMKNRITISLTGGSALHFYVFARRSTDDYRRLLRETYPEIYREDGFHWFEE